MFIRFEEPVDFTEVAPNAQYIVRKRERVKVERAEESSVWTTLSAEQRVLYSSGAIVTTSNGEQGILSLEEFEKLYDPPWDNFSFSLSKEEKVKAQVFLSEHRKHEGRTAIGGAFTFEFTDTSIGTVVKVRCSCGEKVDVTNYDEW